MLLSFQKFPHYRSFRTNIRRLNAMPALEEVEAGGLTEHLRVCLAMSPAPRTQAAIVFAVPSDRQVVPTVVS
jgi:hypothetical protein